MKLYKDRKWLYQKYITENLPGTKIAKLIGCNMKTIYRWLGKFNIPIKKYGENDFSKFRLGLARKYSFNKNIFKTINNSEKAYWLGFLMADGYISKHGICLTLKDGDEDHIRKFKAFLGAENPLYRITKKRSTLNISSVSLPGDLKKYGLIQRKTGKEIIKNIPGKYVSHFIRGYFDGDGCISMFNDNPLSISVSFASASHFLLSQIKRILQQNYIIKNPSIIKHNTANCWYLTAAGANQVGKFIDYLYKDATVCLERKLEVYFEYLRRRIMAYEKRFRMVAKEHKKLTSQRFIQWNLF